ncbi:hypothetical protein AZE99_09935 [Sphingorhabdus sp. M41]|nr:hypothetical protein AZE99_09935 [Sphingorhabdus sp. M41]
MEEHGLIHGWAAPFYGPQGREAYVTYSFGREIIASDADSLRQLTDKTEIFHNKMVRLAERGESSIPSLSNRENEVLLWIARGKSNSDIATILDISGSSVDTYVRRIFEKLSVNHRIAAILKGLHLGLVRL